MHATPKPTASADMLTRYTLTVTADELATVRTVARAAGLILTSSAPVTVTREGRRVDGYAVTYGARVAPAPCDHRPATKAHYLLANVRHCGACHAVISVDIYA